RDLLQSAIPPAPQGMGDTEPVPHGTTPVTPASGRAAFTAEFRQTPPPRVSASLIPEIHDRIAALFTEAAPVSDGAAQDPGTPPLPSVKGLTLPSEVRERIIALFIGGPSDTQVSHQSGTPQTAPAATGAAASQLSAPTAATSPALQSAAGEPVPIVPGSQPLPASPVTTASSLPPPSGAPLASQPLPPTTTVTPDLPDAEPVRAGTAP